MKNKIQIATLYHTKKIILFQKLKQQQFGYGFFKFSKFKNENIIFGNTSNKDYLTKNYINIKLKINKKLSSQTIEYCNNVIKIIDQYNFDLIEIHNRPLVYLYLKKKINNKFILYFHNDPLNMKGSKSISERLFLLDNVSKIIFVSQWVQKRFFLGLDEKLINKTEVIYPIIKKIKKIKKKNKNIVFIGKLNESKGYDVYKDSIIRILNEYNSWKAFSIGDENRKRPHINHPNHYELGFMEHKKVLEFLNKCEIAVVPSRWEEPFGRTALESSSRACATIISNKGGLPETTDHKIVLKKLSSNELYNSIQLLINKKKFRQNIQYNVFKNVKHITKHNAILFDIIIEKLVHNFSLNYIRKKLRIINIYNTGQKLNHRLYNISIGKKFTNGFIRNGHDVLEISDRDFVKQNRTFSFKSTKKKISRTFNRNI